MDNWNKNKANHAEAVNARQEIFKPIPKLVTRVLNMFKAISGDEAKVERATAMARKFRGETKAKSCSQEFVIPKLYRRF